MAIRMHFPSDVNPEPEATFTRGMAQAFPADPYQTARTYGSAPRCWC